jgi:C_GCAxxG_C_C family probable redox protein
MVYAILKDLSYDELMKKVEENVRANNEAFLNCAECVFKAVYDLIETDFPPEIVTMMTGVGSGLAITGGVCGAVVGGMAALSLVHGRQNPFDGPLIERVKRMCGNPGLWRFFNQFPTRFRKKFGSVNCKDLLKEFFENGPIDTLHIRSHEKCLEYQIYGAKLAINLLLEVRGGIPNYDFGDSFIGNVDEFLENVIKEFEGKK